MQYIFGIFYHFIGGFAAASFYIPLKRIRGWAWESYWIIGGLASWLLVPWIAAWLTVPHFTEIIRHTSVTVLFWTYVLGLLWGVGGLTYGMSMRYLGLSLGISITLGLTSIVGALGPPIFRDFAHVHGQHFSTMIQTTGGQFVIFGALISLVGIAFCGKAGMRKEALVSEADKKTSVGEFNLSRGLVVAIISGVLSACFNFGMEAGRPMAESALHYGANPLFQNNVIFVVLLWGGLTTNLIFCLWCNARNRTFGNYVDRKTPLLSNYLFAILAGTTWFLQFFFYGMGASRLNNDTASWILHMSFIILLGNIWGVLLKEWRGTDKGTIKALGAGILFLFISVLVVGYGNSI